MLVIVGVNERGEKHLLAVGDGMRASTQSWREVLLDLKRRGLTEVPKLGPPEPKAASAATRCCR